MRKVLTVMLLVLLSAALVSCNLEDANGALKSGGVTKSYTKARNQFHEVTGIYLPLFPDIEITEDCYKNYKSGDTTYHFHTTVSDSITIDTYMIIENCLKDALGNCSSGPIEDSNQRTATWEVGGRRYTSLFEKPGRIMIHTELL